MKNGRSTEKVQLMPTKENKIIKKNFGGKIPNFCFNKI